jgi:hypothetical protein
VCEPAIAPPGVVRAFAPSVEDTCTLSPIENLPVVGGGGGVVPTVTEVFAFALPPVPTQFKLYVVLVVGVTTCVPLVAFDPVNVPPLAVQLVAFVVDQESVDDPPDVIDAGEAERETVGSGDGVGLGFGVEPLPPLTYQ